MLLERADQLGLLEGDLETIAASGGRIVALIGEGGAGKTSLAEVFLSGLPPTVRVLRSACENLSIPDPLGPLHDLAREADWPIERYLGSGSERLGLFSAALGAFGQVGRTTVILVEDMHWADDATLDFVRYVGRRIGQIPVLLVLTARDDTAEGRRRLARSLADMPAERLRRVAVPSLSEAAVAVLAREAGEDAAEVYRASAGNPFLATELIRAGGRLPDSVRDATLARIDRLSPAGRHVLAAVSVFPRRVEVGVLAKVLDGDLGGVDECLSQGMLEHSGGGYAFRHEIARRAMETSLTELERIDLNARALAALQQLGGTSWARLVHHAVQARDAATVRQLAPVAAHEASRIGAHREAAEHYAAMLQLADDFDLAERAQLLGRYAFECHLVGRLDAAVASEEEARQLYAALGDKVMEGDALRWLSRFSYLNGCRDDAERYGGEAIALLETQPPGPELAMAYSNRSQLAMLADDAETAVSDGRAAIALGQVLGRPDIISHALNNMGAARIWSEPGQGVADLRESLAIALNHNFQEHAARSYTNLSCCLFNALHFAEMRSVAETGIAYCRERDLTTWAQYMGGWYAEVLLRMGELDAVPDVVEPILADETASSMMRYNAAAALVRLRLRRGDPGIAPLLADLETHLVSNQELQRLAPHAALLAEQAWLGVGDRTAAIEVLNSVMRMASHPLVHPEIPVWLTRLGAPPALLLPPDLSAPCRHELAGDSRAASKTWLDRGSRFDAAMALAGGNEADQREAVEMFEAMGAHASADRVRTLMRRRGIVHVAKGPRRSTRNNALGLTRREMEILELASRGLSSKRIAADLAIAPKTVDHHVASLLAKLGSHSRVEAIAVARKAGVI